MNETKTFANTKWLVESALMLALATLLSELKFGGLWAFGGGVTPGSMVPILLISYRWGVRRGCLTAFAYSLLQLLLGMDNIQYAQTVGMAAAILLLEYLLPYTLLGASSLFKGRFRQERTGILLGITVTLGIRFLCHFFVGWIIWDALWPNEFGMAAPLYSLLYNGSYMLPELVLSAAICCFLLPWSEQHLAK